jgi:hypothetical protein
VLFSSIISLSCGNFIFGWFPYSIIHPPPSVRYIMCERGGGEARGIGSSGPLTAERERGRGEGAERSACGRYFWGLSPALALAVYTPSVLAVLTTPQVWLPRRVLIFAFVCLCLCACVPVCSSLCLYLWLCHLFGLCLLCLSLCPCLCPVLCVCVYVSVNLCLCVAVCV